MDVYNILRQLGITRNYRGYRNTVVAVRLVLNNMSRLEAVTKEVYYDVAEECDCRWSSVERNIRTVVRRAWTVNPEFIMEMAGYPLHSIPTVSEFIEMIANYIIHTEESTVALIRSPRD